MRSSLQSKIIVVVILLLAGSQLSFAQRAKAYFYENEVEISVPLKNKWSMDVDTGYRGLLQERFDGEEISGSRHEHLEINHFTNFAADESLILSLGLRYRFKELFDDSEVDEFRIIEQLEIGPGESRFPLSHRFRVEQRFRENMIHRLRYELGYSRGLSETFALGIATEALYAVSKDLKPEAEQRLSLGLENSSFSNLELELTLQYRLENYIHDLAHEFFVITGINYSFN